MQNFDDLDIEGRNPSHLSEADKEKVILEKCFVKILLFIMLKKLYKIRILNIYCNTHLSKLNINICILFLNYYTNFNNI